MPLYASVYMCLVVTCWERADLLALFCGVLLWVCYFPLVSWVRGQVWYLIVSIPDLCTLTYFYFFCHCLKRGFFFFKVSLFSKNLFSNHYKLSSLLYNHLTPSIPQGVVLWYFHTYVGSGHFSGFKILNFNIFLGFQKNKYFWGYEDFVDFFFLNFLWLFHGQCTEWGMFFGVGKISISWGGGGGVGGWVLESPDIFGGER